MYENDIDQEAQDLAGMFSSLKKAAKKKTKFIKKAVKHKTGVAKKKLSLTKSTAKTLKKVQDSKLKTLRGKKSAGASFKEGMRDIKAQKLAIEKEIHRATMPKAVANRVDKVKASPAFQKTKKAVGMAVATYFAGPLVGKAVGGAFSAAGASGIGQAIAAKGAAMGAGSLTASIGKQLAQTGVSEVAKGEMQRRLKKRATAQQKKLAEQAYGIWKNESDNDTRNMLKLSNDPEFQAKIKQMRLEGKSYPEIEAAWANSNTFQNLVGTEVPKTAYPMLYEELRAAGVPDEYARTEAQLMADEMTGEAAGEIADASKMDMKKLLMIGLPVLTMLTIGV